MLLCNIQTLIPDEFRQISQVLVNIMSSANNLSQEKLVNHVGITISLVQAQSVVRLGLQTLLLLALLLPLHSSGTAHWDHLVKIRYWLYIIISSYFAHHRSQSPEHEVHSRTTMGSTTVLTHLYSFIPSLKAILFTRFTHTPLVKYQHSACRGLAMELDCYLVDSRHRFILEASLLSGSSMRLLCSEGKMTQRNVDKPIVHVSHLHILIKSWVCLRNSNRNT